MRYILSVAILFICTSVLNAVTINVPADQPTIQTGIDAANNMSNVQVQALSVEAGLTGDPELIMQAIAMDPLTSAVCTLKQIREMTEEMLEAEREWLPQFEGRKLRPAPAISITKDTKPVTVPLDPALAIVHRFGQLAEQDTSA